MSRLFSAGSGQLLQVSAAPVTTMPLTMACWFYASNVTTNVNFMSLNDGANDNRWYTLNGRAEAAGDFIAAEIRSDTGNPSAISTAGYTASTWRHACGVFTSNTSRTVYLDGGNSATDTNTGNPAAQITSTSIGARSFETGAGARLMSGRIAYATIWNIALTADQVAMLARGVSPWMVRGDAIVGFWPCGISSPDVDLSKNKNNMTVTNAPTVANNPPVGPLWGSSPQYMPYVVAAPAVTLNTRKLLLGVGR